MKTAAFAAALVLAAAPAYAQLGGALGKIEQGEPTGGEGQGPIAVSEADERKIGEEVSARSARSSASTRTRPSRSTSRWWARCSRRPAPGPASTGNSSSSTPTA